MKNVYGYDTFLEVPIPKGEELLDIRFPIYGERVLPPNLGEPYISDREHCYGNVRIILKPKPVLNNYGYKTYEEVPIPDGYEFVGVRLPTGDDEYISGSDAPFRVKPKTVRVIVKKKPQLNAYGFTNYEQVIIPKGYEKVGIFEPTESGVLYIPKDNDGVYTYSVYTSGGPMEVRSPRTEAYEPLKHDRVIVRKKPILNEYGYERYEDVPLPAGEKFLKVAAPKQGDRVLGVSGSAYTSNSNFTSTKRIILQPRTKRYAVAKVELPDSWSDVQSVHSGSYCLVPDYKPGIRPASLETDWTITEEPC